MGRKRKSVSATDIDMTPMIDVTFQLITFFMFTLNFVKAEQDQRVQLPISQVAKPVENSEIEPLILQLLDDGELVFKGYTFGLADLGPYLEEAKSGLIERQQEPSAATVIVRADGRSRTGDVQQLIRSCQEKGFDKFVLRTEYRGQ